MLTCYRCNAKLQNSENELEGFLWVDDTRIDFRLCVVCGPQMHEFWATVKINSTLSFQDYLDTVGFEDEQLRDLELDDN